ncbi:hypothetical protein TNCV_886641 [Trichonephila clavipes]|uniref:Uncharacterized protein n=1 Tax=Trichonephila clavipes TaxID=2585209 RepID=A0A8X6R7S8_TRICX|nr:hypothetical protein TNCV_886641 [Trichonephila clavipes]
MLPVLGKKAVLEWCMKEGLIGSSYVCPKCGKSMELRERTASFILRVEKNKNIEISKNSFSSHNTELPLFSVVFGAYYEVAEE